MSSDLNTPSQSAYGADMRGQLPLNSAVRGFRQLQRPCAAAHGCRAVHISATPTAESPILNGDILSNSIDASTESAGT